MSRGEHVLMKTGILLLIIGLGSALSAASQPEIDYLWFVAGVIVTGLGVGLMLLNKRFENWLWGLNK